MEAVDLGYIHKIFIRHDNAMLNPSWFLDRIEVVDKTDEGRRYVFLCERWLSKNKDDKKIKRNLYEKSFDVSIYFIYLYILFLFIHHHVFILFIYLFILESITLKGTILSD